MAVLTMRLAASHSATLSMFATAVPPLALISATTFCAGPASLPSPATEAPMSLTTTLAPLAAIASAKSRPMPPPAPVTTTTLSLSIACMLVFFLPPLVARGNTAAHRDPHGVFARHVQRLDQRLRQVNRVSADAVAHRQIDADELVGCRLPRQAQGLLRRDEADEPHLLDAHRNDLAESLLR